MCDILISGHRAVSFLKFHTKLDYPRVQTKHQKTIAPENAIENFDKPNKNN